MGIPKPWKAREAIIFPITILNYGGIRILRFGISTQKLTIKQRLLSKFNVPLIIVQVSHLTLWEAGGSRLNSGSFG